MTWGVFVFNDGVNGQAWALAFLPLPLVAWAALRFGASGTSLALIILSVGAAYGTATGHGPFHRANPIEGTLALWIFMATGAVLGWLITALHVARAQATGVHRLFEQALRDVSLGMLLTDLNRRITYANQGFTRLTGYTEAELLGKNCSLLQGPETDPATVEKLKAALRGDGFFDSEILNYRKDGTSFWNALIISPVLDEHGVRTGFLGVQRDFTERKQTALALIESEDRFRKLIEHAPEAIQLLDVTSGRFLQVNSASERLFKRSAAELCRTGPMEMSPPRQPDGRPSSEKGMEFIARVVAGETPVFEWTHRDAEGRDIDCEVRLLRIEIGGRAVVRGSVTDITERKAAESALRASEQYRRTIIEAEPECVKVVSSDGTLLDMNPAGLNMLEAASFAEAASCPLLRYLLPEHQGAFAELHRRVMAGGSGVLEFEIQGRKGTRRWLETHAVFLPGGDGGKPALLGITRDVTERKKAQVEAQRAQERLATIFRACPDSIMIVRASDERIVEVNPAFERIMGFTAAEALGRTTLELDFWVDLAQRAAIIAQINANGAVVNGEARLRSKSGRVFDALGSAEMINYDGERCMLSLTRDITERKVVEVALAKARQTLEKSERHFRALIEQSSDGIAVFTAEGVVRYASPAAAAITGYEIAELVGSNALSHVHEEDLSAADSLFRHLVAKPVGIERFEQRLRRKDGTTVWIEVAAQNLLRDPAVQGIVVNYRDATERLAAERAVRESKERIRNLNVELEQRVQERTSELKAANQELEAFSYSVSHDLRAPLRAIDGFSKMLQQDSSSQLDERGLRYLDRIRSGTERMGALIDDMLKLSRLSRAPMRRVEMDLTFLVRGALAELRAAEPEREVESIVAPGLKAEADPTLLRAVLQNFVGNAWKYTSRRPKARIEFGAFDRDGERVFFIRDDGAGFDMAYADKLFGAFQRLHSVDEFEGTGIGLATVQRVIHRHGGRVWAEAAVNQGATFYFTLAPKLDRTRLAP